MPSTREYTPDSFAVLLYKKAAEAPFELERAIRDIIDTTTGVTRANEPKKSGYMTTQTQGETALRSESLVEGVSGVLKTAPQGLFLTEGTGVYGKHHTPVVPVEKEYLHFFIGEEEFFRRSVKGTPQNDFFDRSVNAVRRSYLPHRLGELGRQSANLERGT